MYHSKCRLHMHKYMHQYIRVQKDKSDIFTVITVFYSFKFPH